VPTTREPADRGDARITLLGRPGCHLCDDARAVIARVAADLGIGWEERDITRSPDDLEEYWDKIPVTLVDGVQHDFWRVTESRLRAALAASLPVSGAAAAPSQAKVEAAAGGCRPASRGTTARGQALPNTRYSHKSLAPGPVASRCRPGGTGRGSVRSATGSGAAVRRGDFVH